MKKLALLLLASALPGLGAGAAAQTAPAQTCALPEIVDQAPLEQVSGSDLMTVPVAVNGTTKQFLLDVAMTKPTTLSPELVAKLGLPEASKNIGWTGPAENEQKNVLSGAQGFTAGIDALNGLPMYNVGTGMGAWALNTRVRVSSFGIGAATGRHLQMKVAQKGEIGRTAPYEGYLTGDFFRQYDVDLDFSEKKITWLTASKCTDPNQAVFWAHSDAAVVPVTLAKDGRYQMQAMVAGHLINAEIDTSSPNTVMRRGIAEQYVGLKADTPQMIPLGGLKDGKGMQIYVSNFPEIVFAGGGVTADNVPVMIQDYSMIPALYRDTPTGRGAAFADERIPDLVIGMDVLQHLHMYLMPGVGRVYVTSADTVPQ